jgi:hypothetical protein
MPSGEKMAHRFGVTLRWRAALAVAFAAGIALLVAGRSFAFNADYCNRFVPTDGSFCEAAVHHITYNSGTTSSAYGPGLCVYAITDAGNIRGNGRTICTTTARFVNECFYPSSPPSHGRTYPLFGGKWLLGHIDDSPNHTGCLT